jgi:hypothetical protein
MFTIGIVLILLKLVGVLSCSWTVLLVLVAVMEIARWVWAVIQFGTLVTAVRRSPVRRTRRSRPRSRQRLF